MSVPLFATAELKDRDTEMFHSDDASVHPLTGTAQRYVLGHRFHTANNPQVSTMPISQYRSFGTVEHYQNKLPGI